MARVRSADREEHSVRNHLLEAATHAGEIAAKIGCALAGELIGLVHDLGKLSADFQAYILSAAGLLDPDDEEYVDAESFRGRIDHSTAGAQWIWQTLSTRDERSRQTAQLLALCVVSHHGGMIDCVRGSAREETKHVFAERMAKGDGDTHLTEALDMLDADLADRVQELLDDPALVDEVAGLLDRIKEANESTTTRLFQYGLAARFLFSALIDADRLSAADFEHPERAAARARGVYTPWPVLIERVERELSRLADGPSKPIDVHRRVVADECYDRAYEKRGGIRTLSAPTGSGKTLGITRFAVHHVQARGLDRIVYVLPFTSIIDQNAEAIRRVLEPGDALAEQGRVVLEHHSNLTPERETWRSRLLSENWDAPVVFTTMVQFLEACFGGGTRGVRRMHQLANAVIIFDEVQSLPVRCVHLFANAVNFLAEQCNSTIVLSTATQPLLHRVDARRGAIRLSGDSLVSDVGGLYEALKRVDVVSDLRPQSADEIAVLSLLEQRDAATGGRGGSCLLIANTRRAAQRLYHACKDALPSERQKHELFFLSATMCPAHRRERLAAVRARLDQGLPTICVSTQVIEAGIDVDFDVVIRCLAGLDSIAQAAGRANRHGLRERGRVIVVDLEDEQLGSLVDIEQGAQATRRVFRDIAADPQRYGDPLGPTAMDWYYELYFFARAGDMSYSFNDHEQGRGTLLDLLSTNTTAFQELGAKRADVFLPQAFKEAGRIFEAIAPTEGILIPYNDDARSIIEELRHSDGDADRERWLLRRGQAYSVNVYPTAIERARPGILEQLGATGIRVLADNDRYSDQFGLDVDLVGGVDRMVL